MPLPLFPIALRLGAAAMAGYAAGRWVLSNSHPGRLDQRAEDALDDLDEGLTLRRPQQRQPQGQTNATARLRRVIRFRGREWELDAGLVARLRLRERQA
ncbi:hypothetical protein [Neotabrizicola sp. VNH66]|uniref:hypothetical protein n=1 Tax=Neotabrizicola sp. VNH66 TaxID=3400918 RepID=UPI003C0DB8DA